MKSRYWILGLLLLLGAACGRSNNEEETAVPEEVSYNAFPAFSADSAYSYIQKQVSFGPRVPNTAGHAAALAWFIEKFASYGLDVQTQEFTAKTHDGLTWKLTNVIASHNPSASKRILLGAHWDTRRVADKDTERINEPIQGANDGGSGVGVLLEIARVISTADLPLNVGVDIILFDGEDDGEPEHARRNNSSQIWWCLGSQHWSNNPHKAGYGAYFGILVDMVGGKSARFYKEGYSVQYAKNLVDRVWRYGHHLGHSDFFIMRQTEAITDDHLFVNKDANIPMINIIEYSPDYGFGHYHHTHMDNMDLIDRKTLQVVGETVLFTLYQE
nr:M28 family peptidase [Cytophagales bacterium]